MSDLRQQLEKVIREHAAPAMDLDGTMIEVLDIDRGCARIRLNGACASCPSTLMTMITGLESEIRQHLPEIEYLEAVP